MKYVREFDVWSKSGHLLDPEYGKDVLQQKLWEKGVPRDVFIGLSEINGENLFQWFWKHHGT
ncbi:hypothetical protein, partial [Verminephrobacter aporrectodeae]